MDEELREEMAEIIEDALEDKLQDLKEELRFSLEETAQETINDSISEFFEEGIDSFLSDHQFVLKDGTIIQAKQKTKVLSPDKTVLLSCYGGLRVQDASKWNGNGEQGWALSVQTRISCWDVIYVYEDKNEAIEALEKVKDAMEQGLSLVEL